MLKIFIRKDNLNSVGDRVKRMIREMRIIKHFNTTSVWNSDRTQVSKLIMYGKWSAQWKWILIYYHKI